MLPSVSCPHSPLLSLRRTTTTISSSLHNPTSPQDPVLRQHNSKSTSLLLRHLSNNHESKQQQQQEQRDLIPPEDKIKLLEMSLVTKRPPQFPGSIYDASDSLLQPLQTIFKPNNTNLKQIDNNNDDLDDVDEEMIMKALDIRRKVTAEIFKNAMKRTGKFGITYSTNVTDRVIEDSNVVPLIRWLKHNGLSYPKIAKLICMSSGNLESIRYMAQWLKSIHVKGEFLGVALLKSGGNVFKRNVEELNEIVDYLESNGVRRDWMGYVMSRCPQLLSQSIEEVKMRVQFYLHMGMNQNDFGTMVFDYPKVLGFLSLEEMNQKVSYLKEFGLSTEEVGRLLAFKPHLMGCSIEERWKPLVKYLYYLGISRDGMRRMLTIKPIVFCVDFETTIVPKVKFFQDIGVRDDGIANMLVKFPPLLTYSLYKKIRPVVIFLITKAGVNERDIGKCISQGPELLGCSIGNKLEVNVKYFLSLGIKLQQLGEMIADFPMLLRYNIDLLRPKYRYLRRTMVRPLQDLIEFPRFFSYSLEERIIPRHKVMVENQINFKLRYMLACSDEEFSQKVADKLERRRRFELGLVNEAVTESQTDDDSPGKREEVAYSETANSIFEPQAVDPSVGRTELDRSNSNGSQSCLTQ
ncbi:Transcription termination factor like [Melia azedarach]|uniref:Transcription termination factor like n=1 Tax=Melia azedarach TaxID=155640 RepID=A0ACC1XYH9_MELAZ|nr:Transcription termination factor like [Melia azedarach]